MSKRFEILASVKLNAQPKHQVNYKPVANGLALFNQNLGYLPLKF